MGLCERRRVMWGRRCYGGVKGQCSFEVPVASRWRRDGRGCVGAAWGLPGAANELGCALRLAVWDGRGGVERQYCGRSAAWGRRCCGLGAV